MSHWEQLEKQQFTTNRMLRCNDDEVIEMMTIKFEKCETEIQKIKDLKHLPQIINYLNSNCNLIPFPGDKKYLDTRISKYEKVLKEYQEKQEELKSEPKTRKTKESKEPIVKNKKKVSATLKRLVWNSHIGEEIGKAKCMCCKSTDITQMSFHCGHIIAEANGGELIISNLRPICQNCNSSMGTKNMNDFVQSFK
jgi:5-methylcytosine-specific restriction endonuclease McrA